MRTPVSGSLPLAGVSRRAFLGGLPLLLASRSVRAGETKTRAAHVSPNAASTVNVSVCHIGYRTASTKRAVISTTGPGTSQEFQLLSGSLPIRSAVLQPVNFGSGYAYVWDFSDLTTPGTYQCVTNGGSSVTFAIGDSVWLNNLSTVFKYHTAQRCGTAVAGVHTACHLDDARRRDTGQTVSATGGWHDAGDLRKWVDATLMNLFGILAIARNLGAQWNPAGLTPLLNEAKWGNAYFLKMQDVDGLIWADTAGGVNGDNSDNHWTDNTPGTADDRWINTSKNSNVQAMFIAAEAMMNQTFATVDGLYASKCLDAAVRCWGAADHNSSNTTDLGWWLLAAVEMYRATGQSQYSDEIVRLANTISGVQFKDYVQGQQFTRGFFPQWPGNSTPLVDPVYSGIPCFALLQAAEAMPGQADATGWRDAVSMYLDDYVAPMTSLSAYRALPYGIFIGSPTADIYRPLGGNLTYRFFMPAKSIFLGLTSHLLSHALLLGEAAKFFGRTDYRNLAYAQLEWVFGVNPFNSTLATGLGYRNPAAFSPFVGPIRGGIMNGICGDVNDNPVLPMQNAAYWPSNEYWSPHVGFCEWALSVLASD